MPEQKIPTEWLRTMRIATEKLRAVTDTTGPESTILDLDDLQAYACRDPKWLAVGDVIIHVHLPENALREPGWPTAEVRYNFRWSPPDFLVAVVVGLEPVTAWTEGGPTHTKVVFREILTDTPNRQLTSISPEAKSWYAVDMGIQPYGMRGHFNEHNFTLRLEELALAGIRPRMGFARKYRAVQARRFTPPTQGGQS